MAVPVKFRQALAAHELSLSEDHAGRLAVYCEALWDWNSRLNLTRHTDFESFVTRDLPDCQKLAGLLSQKDSVLDVGSGGGVPGIVIAILRPDLTITLAESTQKKATVLQSIVGTLSLPVAVLPERGEDVLRRASYDTVMARAIAPLRKLLPWFQPHRRKFKRLLLVKGPNWRDELQAAEEAGVMKRISLNPVEEYSTPGRDGKSVILEVIM